MLKKITLAIIVTITISIHIQAMQEEPSLTTMPLEIIRTITSFLGDSRDVHSLQSTSRQMNVWATHENRRIVIQCSDQRGAEESVQQFLAKVSTCIKHICTRHGNNRLKLMLDRNRLSDDMETFNDFLLTLSTDTIAPYIEEINFTRNQLSSLPMNLQGLTHLKSFGAQDNMLTVKDLQTLQKCTQLELVDISWNPALRLVDIYRTIGRLSSLKHVTAFSAPDLEDTPDKIFTEEEMQAINPNVSVIF